MGEKHLILVTMAARGLILGTGRWIILVLLLLCLPLVSAHAHAIGDTDAAFVAATHGPVPFPFIYLGAKHMVTGYDHILFLVGVVFFLRRLRDVVLYVSLFSLGHSITLIAGVLLHTGAEPHLVDAVIGLSVIYKAIDNLDGFGILLGKRPDARLATAAFGLCHGLGLATKLEQLRLRPEGLFVNLLSFNLGVELGQILALALVVGAIAAWRRLPGFARQARIANVLLLTAGVVLAGEQLAAWLLAGKG